MPTKKEEILNQRYIISNDTLNTFRGTPSKIRFEKGEEFYRIITPGQNYVLGAYWFREAALKKMKQFAKANNCSLEEVARPWQAVQVGWNKKMSHVCQIRLKTPCYAWVGPSRFQPTIEGSNVLYMGNTEQVFLPNLTEENAAITTLLDYSRTIS